LICREKSLNNKKVNAEAVATLVTIWNIILRHFPLKAEFAIADGINDPANI
jgi:hypothetical protein